MKFTLFLENVVAGAEESSLQCEIYKDHVEITGCDTSAGLEVIIPETIMDLPVTSINEITLGLFSHVISVTIPNSVTSIKADAFMWCSDLVAIHVAPGNLYYMDIDGVLFSKDQKILIRYPAGKTDSFYSIPDGVTSIECGAFERCRSLESVIIPDSVINIGSLAFGGCFRLKPVTIPNSVISIGNDIFLGCFKGALVSDFFDSSLVLPDLETLPLEEW